MPPDPPTYTSKSFALPRPNFTSLLSTRWLTLLLSQEFSLPDVQRIWDSILSDPTRVNLLVDLCAAMVVLVRGDVLQNEFPDNMKLLQSYPPMDVQHIITRAAQISTTGR